MQHQSDGYTGVTILPGKVSTDDLVEWTEAFGITHPVLADTYNDANRAWSLNKGRPQFVVLDRDLEVVFNDTSDHEGYQQAILDTL